MKKKATEKAPEPFVMVFVFPCTEEGEIRSQFRRFEREFSPSRIVICIDNEKGMSIATAEFPPTDEGRRNVEAYQRMRLGKVLVEANSSSAEEKTPDRNSGIGLRGHFGTGGYDAD